MELQEGIWVVHGRGWEKVMSLIWKRETSGTWLVKFLK
jgi:hypothetical protein